MNISSRVETNPIDQIDSTKGLTVTALGLTIDSIIRICMIGMETKGSSKVVICIT
jgi:hypothetical protein